jgi:serine/threonine-protein kinase
MGAVYLARDRTLNRPIALKVLPPEFAADSSVRERFRRESCTAASFSHPNIVPVHAIEERGGLLAFAMGYVEGESIADRVRRAGPLDVRSLVRLMQDVGYALAYAHGRGIVHRDIKPENIMIERATGRALLMDFGISRSMTVSTETRGLTRVGEVVGTPEYMSPEQASGDAVDGRSDIYSLGLVALFAMTGRPAITDESTQKILVKQLTELPPSATTLRSDLPGALGAAIDTCVAKVPDQRFQTAEALIEVIDNAQLATPEIPLPVRMYAQEVSTLGLILVFLTVISPLLVSTMGTGGSADGIIPLVLLFAIGLTRVMQTSSAARRLALLGFQPAEVVKGMRAVLTERDSVRAQLRADVDTQRRRRTTLILASVQLPLSILLILGALARRTQIGPHSYQVGLDGMIMIISGVIMFGVSLMLFARSPFRAPLGERLFRLVWLGPLGRWFLRFSARNVQRPAGAASQPFVPVVAAVNNGGRPQGKETRSLEARVAALEQWRDSIKH